MNLPNAITVGRVALVPVFLVLAFRDSTSATAAALVVFLIASVSDFVDGYIARRDDKVSRAGQFLDPTADKLLVGAALVVLVAQRDFPLWAAVLLALREIIVQVVRTNIVRDGGTLPSSATGKIKTVSQIVMVSWWLLPWEQTNMGHWILLGEVLIFSFVSGVEYVVRRPKSVASERVV
ncbi:MAG TPA: CDP-diacylglycerol--glycerol-3-phosphate 3-phosphatidyltransferase [Actinomycetota bacterium]|nr:CDP-diacylglycerol--glycerol-3-phosphate 3-phosphatidyltransferase [Actinomycetota bacterium]